MRKKNSLILFCVLFATLGASCKTKRDVRREQEYERIKAEVREARGARADLEVISEEFRTELVRLSAAVEEQGQLARVQNDELRREIQALQAKTAAIEQQLAAPKEPPPPPVKKAATFDAAKGLFDDGKFEEAIEEAKLIVRTRPKTSADARKAQYLLGDAYFAAKDYGAAALEYSEFKKTYPKDPNAANATLRQALCFKSLGKEKEAKLFYQEILERYPKSPAAAQAKKELGKKSR